MMNPAPRPVEQVKETPREWPPYVFPVIFTFGIPLALYYLTILSRLIFHFPQFNLPEKKIHWPLDTDFLSYWSAARLALNHQIMILFDSGNLNAAQHALTGYAPVYAYYWPYPLHFLPVILGLGLFPYEVAFGVWMASTFALYAFAVAYKRPQPWKLAAALALAPASFYNVYLGQNGFLVAAFFVGGLRLIEKRPTLAGIALGLMTIKPQMIVLLPIVILSGKHWRVLAVAGVTSTVLVAISLTLAGTEAWLAYFHKVIPLQVALFEQPPSVDNFAMNKSFVTVFSAVRALGGSLSLGYRLSALSALGAVGATIYACRRASSDLRDMMVLTATFLAAPYAHVYDMPILTAAVVSFFAAQRVKPATFPQIVLIVGLCLFPLYFAKLNTAGMPVCPLLVAGFLGIGLQAIRAKPKLSEEIA